MCGEACGGQIEPSQFLDQDELCSGRELRSRAIASYAPDRACTLTAALLMGAWGRNHAPRLTDSFLSAAASSYLAEVAPIQARSPELVPSLCGQTRALLMHPPQ